MRADGAAELHTVAEASARLRVHPTTLLRRIRAGRFPGIRVTARRYLVPRQVIDDMVAAAVSGGGCVDAGTWSPRSKLDGPGSTLVTPAGASIPHPQKGEDLR